MEMLVIVILETHYLLRDWFNVKTVHTMVLLDQVLGNGTILYCIVTMCF